MARRLFTVEDTFFIGGRGLIAVPGIIPQRDEVFRVGDSVQIRRPDGSVLVWKIGGLEIMHGGPPRDDLIVLFVGVSKDDLPVGSEIWSIDPNLTS